MIGASSFSGEGLDELLQSIDRHRDLTTGSDAGLARRRSIAEFRLRKTAENLLYDRFNAAAASASAKLAEQLMRRESDPYSLAEELLSTALEGEGDHERDVHSKPA